MIIRRKVNKNYTVITNEALNDDRLSFAALGLLCYLRGRPHDWTVQLEQLRKREGCGRERMQALMRELIEAGWVLRQESRKSGRGTFAGIEYVVLDEPHEATSARDDGPTATTAPESEKPTAAPESGLPEPGKPESENPTPYKVKTLQNTDSSDPIGSAPGAGAVIRDFRKELFDRGPVAVRSLTGRPEARARTLIGSWLKLAADDAVTVLRAIDEAVEAEPIDAVGWIEARLRRRPVSLVQPTAAVPPDIVASHNARAMAMVERGEWPIGGTVFVPAESPEGAAWEAYFERFGRRPRWTSCAGGLGWRMPSAMPPDLVAAG